MLSGTFSMLLPTAEKKNAFYEDFFKKYSLLISTNLIVYDAIDAFSEQRIFEEFSKFNGSYNDYKDKEVFQTFMLLEDNYPQKKEQRGLFLNTFFIDRATGQKDSKSFIISAVNIKEFTLLYALFEGVMKELFRANKVLDKEEYLNEKDIITKFASSSAVNKKLFLQEMRNRSPLSTFDGINTFWLYFTHFRHLYFHSGGYVTKQWFNKYIQKKEDIIKKISKFNDITTASQLCDAIKAWEVTENKMCYMEDNFVNFFRNFIIRFMESMYLSG